MKNEHHQIMNEAVDEFEKRNWIILGVLAGAVIIGVIQHYLFGVEEPWFAFIIGAGALIGAGVNNILSFKSLHALKRQLLEKEKENPYSAEIDAYRELQNIKTQAQGEQLQLIADFEERRRQRQRADQDELKRLHEELDRL